MSIDRRLSWEGTYIQQRSGIFLQIVAPRGEVVGALIIFEVLYHVGKLVDLSVDLLKNQTNK
jgi:hypothetical protein